MTLKITDDFLTHISKWVSEPRSFGTFLFGSKIIIEQSQLFASTLWSLFFNAYHRNESSVVPFSLIKVENTVHSNKRTTVSYCKVHAYAGFVMWVFT